MTGAACWLESYAWAASDFWNQKKPSDWTDQEKAGDPNQVGGIPAGGAWTAGEFSTALAAILAAVFTHQRPESVDKPPSLRHDFAIDQSHSSCHLVVDNAPSSPG